MWSRLIFLIVMTSEVKITVGFAPDDLCYRKRMRGNPYECTELERYTPWPNDENCKKFEIRRSPVGTFTKPVALASAGSSGGSWLREMIEKSTGYVIGSVSPTVPNETPETQSRCNLRIWDGRSIVIQTQDTLYHQLPGWYTRTIAYEGEEISWPFLSKIFFQYRGILVVRNPWDVMISSRRAVRKILGTCSICTKLKYRREDDFETDAFTKFLRKGVTHWVNHVTSWIRGSPDGKDMVIIQYEKLIDNPELELRRVLSYLNVTIDDERLTCTLKNPAKSPNPFLRTYELMAKVGNIIDDNPDTNSILENGIIEINRLMKEKGLKDRFDYKRPDFSGLSSS